MDPTAAPVPLRLDGKEYKAYPFRDIDHEEFNHWCRREYLDRVKQSTDDHEILAVAINETIDMFWMGSGRVVASTVKGVHKMASIMCRQQTIHYKSVASKEGIAEVMSVFSALHTGPVGDSNGEDASEGK